MKVYQCINSVQKELSHQGIGKNQKNTMQNYKFRGIDDVFNTLAPLIAKHGLCILPDVLEREVAERKNAKGTTIFYVTVKVKYTFIAAEDSSTHEVIVYGEAMDSSDKATNKAMSAAYKYAAIQAFCIPTEGDNDTENSNHEPQYQNSSNTQAYREMMQSKPVQKPVQKPEDLEHKKAYQELVSIIKTNNLVNQVPGFQSAYNVKSLNELTLMQLNNLIERIQGM